MCTAAGKACATSILAPHVTRELVHLAVLSVLCSCRYDGRPG